ncbi:hypothetical protein HNQ60_000483 [Povalibacter uvarum]|uniref:Glycosyltransferase RgtA/B/C/D-like domain-containing protein n=1 Tax=Povalibacter uvarum TaxID=732238 RepID=A0A841HFI5_9GAMM|nr:glycosyltransferase family 39 protein [Povalibacter uvarum]MBB6091637.1 hypothetical protein [Povalibacter uvarum]
MNGSKAMPALLDTLKKPTTFGLLALFAVAILLRVSVIGVGAPHITIDDDTAFEGGFLVWFGQAPPQRMYIESWLYGLVCIVVYVGKVFGGLVGTGIGVNLVADAYRDFYADPSAYVLAYRWFTLFVDLVSTWLIYRIARHVLGDRWGGWAAVIVAAMYVLSYNILWSGIVARPDSFLTLYCALGLLFYLRSDAGRQTGWLIASAVFLGIAGGQKLHGAFLAIFLSIDLLRVHGLRNGFGKFALLAGISGFFFCVAAGSPLFDPLMYLKLRMANVKDDASPWILWGEQFVTLLRGTGWIIVPATLVGIWMAFVARGTKEAERIGTLAVVALGWLLLFGSIRQMRAYWMLPALPVFYVMAVHALSSMRARTVGLAASAAMLAVLAAQSVKQISDLRAAPYQELQQWAFEDARDRAFYVLGYDALTAPKNTQCMARTRQVVQHLLDQDRAAGVSFTERHVKNWEERTTLMLFDMLGSKFDPGYEFYDFHSAPPEVFGSVVGWDAIQFLVVQDRFDLDLAPAVRDLLDSQFEFVAEKTGAGGGDAGLKYRIYRRR